MKARHRARVVALIYATNFTYWTFVVEITLYMTRIVTVTDIGHFLSIVISVELCGVGVLW